MKRPDLFVLMLTFALATAPGCSKSEDASSDVSFTSAAPPPSATTVEERAATTAPSSDARIVRSPTGTDVVTIQLTPDPRIVLVAGGATTTLDSDMKDSGKRKYYRSGAQIAEVKSSDSGFKVRTADGVLLWKVKIAEDKIKVSDNEENLHPWVLKTGYPDKAKILDTTEVEIGVVRFADATTPARVRTTDGSDAWTIESGPPSAAWGALMMGAIPPEHQAIIVAELLSRGR